MSAKNVSISEAPYDAESSAKGQGAGDTTRLSVILDREMHTQLKVLAAKDHTTVSKIVKSLLTDLLKVQNAAEKT